MITEMDNDDDVMDDMMMIRDMDFDVMDDMMMVTETDFDARHGCMIWIRIKENGYIMDDYLL
jgi:hypothetical protein